jgi:hypothetical protein
LVVDHNSAVDVDIPVYMDIRDVNILHNNGSRTPVTAAVVGFMRSKGYPPDIDSEMDPADPSGIPAEPYAQARVTEMGSSDVSLTYKSKLVLPGEVT